MIFTLNGSFNDGDGDKNKDHQNVLSKIHLFRLASNSCAVHFFFLLILFFSNMLDLTLSHELN